MQHLFEKTTNELVDWDFTIFVTFVEIYNECLLDLLTSDPADAPKLEIKQIGGSNNHHVPGLTHVKVKNVDDINAVSI